MLVIQTYQSRHECVISIHGAYDKPTELELGRALVEALGVFKKISIRIVGAEIAEEHLCEQLLHYRRSHADRAPLIEVLGLHKCLLSEAGDCSDSERCCERICKENVQLPEGTVREIKQETRYTQ